MNVVGWNNAQELRERPSTAFKPSGQVFVRPRIVLAHGAFLKVVA